MKNRGDEFYDGWLERVVGGEINIEEEYATSIWTSVGTGNRGTPFHNIVVERSSATIGRRIAHKFSKFLLKTFVKTHFVAICTLFNILCINFPDRQNRHSSFNH